MSAELADQLAFRIAALAAEWGLGWMVLAAVRWLGLLLTLPALAPSGVTLRMRVLLAILLAGLVLPVISRTPGPPPDGWLELAGLAVAEFLLGGAIGFGMRIVLGAAQLAGELIDHQAGLAISQVFHPAVEGGVTVSGQFLGWVAVVAFLLLPPMGGDLWLTAAMLELFETVPIGAIGSPGSPVDLLIVLTQQSLTLAVRVAAPVLGVMFLVTTAVSWLERNSAGVPAVPMFGSLRIAVCLAVILTTLPGMTSGLVDSFHVLLESVPGMVAGWEG